MAKKKRKSKNSPDRKQILGLLLFILALLVLISLITHSELDDARITNQVESHLNPFEIDYHNQGGMMGAYLALVFLYLIGWLAYFVPMGLIIAGLRLISAKVQSKLETHTLLAFVTALFATILYNIHLIAPHTLTTESVAAGGFVTEKLTILVLKILGETGSYVVMGGLCVILIMTYTSITPWVALRIPWPGRGSIQNVWQKSISASKKLFSLAWLPVFGKHDNHEIEASDDYPEIDASAVEPGRLEGPTIDIPDSIPAKAEKSKPKPPKSTKAVRPINIESFKYEYPSLDTLATNPSPGPSVSRDELQMTARMLLETLETFGVRIEGDVETFPGPIITRFEFKPASGIKVNQIINLADDLALALKARRIRIIAPIPGKAAVGIEIPNRQQTSVFLRDVINSRQFRDSNCTLPLALGLTTAGEPFVADLAKMPHLLIAGATGSGKSVCMNVLITSLIYRLHPLHCRFIFIDPKMLELSVYQGIPHLGRPVVTQPKRAEKVLADTVVEMEGRYRKLANASVRNIADYNVKQTEEDKKLPYIIIFVDELADLMMSTTSSKVELLITRLAQMARAVGIHLVLATQRPSVDVITGLIKANFPARIAFQVSSKVDSRTIIDANGAEKLLGAGDMLYLPSGVPEPIRLHGAFISNEETSSLVDFINNQGLEMLTLKTISQSENESTEGEVDLGDPLFKEACEVCLRHKQGSVSLLQRRLGIGYQRAARLIDRLEQAGIVSRFDGSKAREVIVDRAYVDTLFANALAAAEQHSESN